MDDEFGVDDSDDQPTAPFWMSTFSDMATILLTFFVMIVAMSEVEVKKFKEALSYFQGRTGVMMSDAAVSAATVTVKEEPRHPSYEEVERYEEVLMYLEEKGLETHVEVNLSERGLHVVMLDSVMFRSGSADLLTPSQTLLSLLAGILDTGIQAVVVEGHTDDRPIRTALFASNWELSSARAASVVRFLLGGQSALDASQYVAVGYAEFHPRASNRTPAGRAKNRRVEILFSWEEWERETNKKPGPQRPSL